jgi:hypothetical protein
MFYFSEDEVLLRGFEIGECYKFYEQSVKDMINNSVVIKNINQIFNMESHNHNTK